PTALECEPLLRIYLADFSTPEQLAAALARVRADANAILEQGRIVGPEYLAGTAPFQDQVHVRALVFDFLSHHARMLLDWADRTEAAVAAWPDLMSEERESRARESIRRDLDAFP